MKKVISSLAVMGVLTVSAGNALAGDECSALGLGNKNAIFNALRSALQPVTNDGAVNGGLGNHSWATITDADGVVCAVAFSSTGSRLDQWGLSRVISAQKANTIRGLSLPMGVGGTIDALSTAQLWAANQPGGIFFGLQFSNPVDTGAAYGNSSHGGGSANNYGTNKDPMVGKFIGGVNVFGGGLPLYDAAGNMIGGIGASGDTSCADHNVAWRLRDALALDNVPSGVSATGDDNIIFDTAVDAVTGHQASASGFGHPLCGGEPAANAAVIAACPANGMTDAACTAL